MIPGKIKFLLGFLAVVAGFLLTRVGILLHNKAASYTTANILNAAGSTNSDNQAGASSQQSSAEKALAQDSDQDGLPDREEIIYGTDPSNKDTDQDGFLDSEEILSGHDPLDINDNAKNGPGDNPSSSAANFTDRITSMAVASMVDDLGNINPRNTDQKKLLAITQLAEQEMVAYFNVPKLTDSDIIIGTDSSKETVQKYIDTVSTIIEEQALTANADMVRAIQSTTPITTQSGGYRIAYESLKALPVPPLWKGIHKEVLTFLLSFSRSFDALGGNVTEEDPLKAVAALNQIQSLGAQVPVLLNHVSELAKSQDIQVNDIVLKALRN